MRLTIRDIRKKYNGVNVIDGASYTFESGHVYGISGCEGAGKTTLLRCICGDCIPDRGKVRIDYGEKSLRPVCAEFAFLQKEYVLPEYMTVDEYMDLCAVIHNSDEDKAARCISTIGIKDRKDQLIKDIDDKDRFRVRAAAVLVSTPPVIMIDDIQDYDRKVCKKLLDKVRKEHIVIVTSDKPEELKDVCDEIVNLYGGTLSAGNIRGGLNA